MPKDKITDQFSHDEMNQIKHYGQMLGGGETLGLPITTTSIPSTGFNLLKLR
jgi:hypothetical protein